ncbi:MAG: hydroxymethylpyrimidine/phosphomethylpyrimidine kinase [Candidatus Glassbacteria bacterium]|nr:hydroxymethylpyrimidine/phosphomethylpyrimidine kinase [Candidatus Glassbacteria bacterium]
MENAPVDITPPLALLSISGLSSTGLSGTEGDLKTFAALGTFGVSAVTAIVTQTAAGEAQCEPVTPGAVTAQIQAAMDNVAISAVKVGMLPSMDSVYAAAEALRAAPPPPDHTAQGKTLPYIVADPMVGTTAGFGPLGAKAVEALKQTIFPMASLLTPNATEAALLSGREVDTPEHIESAAKALFDSLGVPVLVTGGRFSDSDEATDVLWDGRELEFFNTPYLRGVNTKGSGCTLSSAAAVYMARGFGPGDAVAQAKDYLQQSLAAALPLGRRVILNHAHAPKPMRG